MGLTNSEIVINGKKVPIGGVPTAKQVPFNSSSVKTDAANVQDAIEELFTSVANGKDPSDGGDGAGEGSIPKGVIVIWSGTTEDIPDGWHLCDGEDGTPDLRDRFVLGAGNEYPVDKTGGSETVTLTVEQMPKHSHEIRSYYNTKMATSNYDNVVQSDGTGTGKISSGTIYSTGGSKPHNNMPPYYALCYIMKL